MNRLTVLLIVCLVLPVLLSAAPVNKADIAQRMVATGVYSVSGSILWAKETYEIGNYEQSMSIMSINPQFGIFAAPGVMLGGGFNFIDQAQSVDYGNGNSMDISASQTLIQLFGRYYVAHRGSSVIPFIGLGVDFASYEGGSSSSSINFTGGMSVPLIEHFALEPKLSYSFINDDTNADRHSLLQMAIGIGTYWY